MTIPMPPPDLILYNGIIATQTPIRSLTRAVAVGGNQILATGDDADILDLAGPQTDRVDLDGRLVVPGFIDTHIHFFEWAMQRQALKLDDVKNLDQLVSRVRQAARGCASGQWIMGQKWNETDWPTPRMPTRQVLDQAAPHHPVLLWRCDLHLAAANSAALQRAGIDANTPDPPEGLIERDDRGEPTGILRELAINRVRQAVAPPSDRQVMGAFEAATDALHRWGVTGIHDVRLMADADGAGALRGFQQLEGERRLRLRSWVSLPGERLDEAIGLGLSTGFGNDYLRIGHVKFFSDGGMGARTAWMIDPFLDAGCGMPLMAMDALAEAITKADNAGLSVMVHAVGDRANREVIDIFSALEEKRARSGGRAPSIPHRIEHVQMIRPEDIARLGRLNLALNVTPANMLLDIHLIDRTLAERGRFTYPFRQLLDAGAPVMFSSDCPVCDPDPLLGIRAAVTRQRDDGTPAGGWHPHHRVSVAQAIRAYTATPAAVHKAADLGMIAPGSKADLAILSQNIISLPATRLAQTRVDMTVFDGRIVYRQF